MVNDIDRSVGGDTDRWVLFDRTTPEGYPLVVLARTGNPLIEPAWQTGILCVVRCIADLTLVNEQGMPQHTDRLYDIEERLARELEAFQVGALHVASVTGDGERRIVYLLNTPLNLDPVLGLFNPQGYRLEASSPSDRTGLRELATPTALDHQLNGDLGVISNLEMNGDNGQIPRKTDFWFYGDKTALERLTKDLEPCGYAVEKWLDEPVGVILTSVTSVTFGAFREITPVLVGVAQTYGVTYDGWETFVVKPTEVAPEVSQEKKSHSFFRKLFGAKKN